MVERKKKNTKTDNNEKNAFTKSKLGKTELKKPTMLSGLLIIGIAIVGFIFILSGMKVFFEEPKYEDFCGELYKYPTQVVKNCNNTPDYPQYCKGTSIPEFDQNTGCISSYSCSDCNLRYDEARENYRRNVFMITIITGILMIVASAFITIPTIQNGLFITSIVLIIFGSSSYWSNLGKYLQFSLMGIALASLIILSYKIYRNQEKKN
jgi:hypothetical protein